MITLYEVKKIFKLFGYKKFKINTDSKNYTAEITIYSFKKLNQDQKEYIYWNKPIGCQFKIKVKIPIIKFTIQSFKI